MEFTQKETALLKDLEEYEKTCVDKYNKYCSEANGGQLKNLFSQLGQNEQQHLNTIHQIKGGTVPALQSGSNNQAQQNQSFADTSQNKQNDSYLCTDALSTEKHVSSVYDTAIFEFKDTNIRNALNHIQKEEQQHGEQIYQYMAQNGMYN